jgi:hypothetical protein
MLVLVAEFGYQDALAAAKKATTLAVNLAYMCLNGERWLT